MSDDKNKSDSFLNDENNVRPDLSRVDLNELPPVDRTPPPGPPVQPEKTDGGEAASFTPPHTPGEIKPAIGSESVKGDEVLELKPKNDKN